MNTPLIDHFYLRGTRPVSPTAPFIRTLSSDGCLLPQNTRLSPLHVSSCVHHVCHLSLCRNLRRFSCLKPLAPKQGRLTCGRVGGGAQPRGAMCVML